ncbi:hypothetical protein INT45_012997 [Circinella minor]|uniref:Uncharacterized protein n=1 Tax=Circinella minor TaxID=1195481 RepID=A0A8H7RWY8_9FUNG|nr:hypothetical protein INT45_012997 [Circinella minor]
MDDNLSKDHVVQLRIVDELEYPVTTMYSSCAIELKFIVNASRFPLFTLVLRAGSSQMQAAIATTATTASGVFPDSAVRGAPSNGAFWGARFAGVGFGGSRNGSGGGAQNEDEDDPTDVDW